MISKKVLLIASFIGASIFITLTFPEVFWICDKISYLCIENYTEIAQVFAVFLPLFILSLITYKMRDEVYQAWFSFARWWIPLSLLAVLITPTTHDWLFPLATKAGIALLSTIFFIVISLVLITWKYLSTRH